MYSDDIDYANTWLIDYNKEQKLITKKQCEWRKIMTRELTKEELELIRKETEDYKPTKIPWHWYHWKKRPGILWRYLGFKLN